MGAKLKSFILTALLFGSLLAVSAQGMPDSVPPVKTPMGVAGLSGKWYLVPVLDSDTATGRLPDIDFNIGDSHFSGSTGCNRMSGSFLATDTSLRISDKMITTRMFCSGYNEATFIKNLLGIDGYKFKNGQLILLMQGAEVSRWSRKPVVLKKMPRPQVI